MNHLLIGPGQTVGPPKCPPDLGVQEAEQLGRTLSQALDSRCGLRRGHMT